MAAKHNGGMAALLKIGTAGTFAIALSGCMGPTYGTDTPATVQLFEDVSGAISLGSKQRDPIAYTPRPELVRPASLDVLPAPQAAAQDANPAWPESPEQRLARVREEATANQDNNLYRSPVNSGSRWQAGDRGVPPVENPQQTREELQRRMAESQQGSATQRRFLSEPPVNYRQPAESAPAGELGEEEWRKERRMQAATGERTGIRSLIPWL